MGRLITIRLWVSQAGIVAGATLATLRHASSSVSDPVSPPISPFEQLFVPDIAERLRLAAAALYCLEQVLRIEVLEKNSQDDNCLQTVRN